MMPKYYSVYLLANKDILIHAHSMLIKIKQLTLIQVFFFF